MHLYLKPFGNNIQLKSQMLSVISVIKISQKCCLSVFGGDKKCGGSVIGERFVATARHCTLTCPEYCSSDWDRCAPNPHCFVKLRSALSSLFCALRHSYSWAWTMSLA